MPKQANENQPPCEPAMANPKGLQPLPEVRFERSGVETECPVGKSEARKLENPLAVVENSAASGSESMSKVGSHSSPLKGRSSKKMSKSSRSTNVCEEAKSSVTESLPEVKAKAAGKCKGREVPSRYMESAKSRGATTRTKMSDSSCLSINQSKLFSTAISSTPVSAGGKVQDVSVRPKQPPKMAPLDATVRQRPSASAGTTPGKDKAAYKIKKSEKAATIKVRPLRAEAPAKKQAGGDRERVSEHQLLYNQYLQWTYLCRVSEASVRSEQRQRSHQARQLSGLVDSARQNCMDLERKVQAVSLYREMVQLERELGGVLTTISDSADTVRADLTHMATALDATRNRLQLKGCVQPRDAQVLVDELLSAAERCRAALSALDGAASPHANLLQHTAEAVSSLQEALSDSSQHMASSSEMLQELSSLVLQEASLSLSAGPPAPRQPALTSSG